MATETNAAALRPGSTSADGRFQLLIDAVVDYGIFMLDTQGHVVSWNSGAEKLKGYRRDDILGRHFSTFYPREVAASGWPDEELRQAAQAGRFEDEGWRVRKDGSRFWANVVITALRDSSGVLTGFAKITRDLTERRRHEEDLRESEARFRLLVESVRDYAIFMLDVNGNVRSWNAGAQALKGYRAEEIIGRHFRAFYTPEDQQAGKPANELRVARQDGRIEDDGWRVRKDGTLFWANVIITAVHDQGGELIGFAKVTRDMTEQRRREELERSSRMMAQFLAMLAHELRNPLAPMRNAVTLMQLEPLHSPTLRSSRDIIDRQLSHVTRLVDDLLDIGRLTTGKIKLRLERVSVAEIVARAAETARPLIDTRGHRLTIDLPSRPVEIMADATRLSQIMQNLLVNSAKYTPEGGHVDVKVRAANGFVTVSVSDNGRGIAGKELERIFELFAQGEQSTPNESGLGVGLTLARSLAEMHGGRLDAESAGPGQGSTFLLRLPAADRDEAAADDAPPSGFNVLVVDDNRDSADSVTAIIRLLGYRAQCVYAGDAALQEASLETPDMVLLDLAMPGLDGYATLCSLRDLPGTDRAFIVAMTGYGSDNDKQRTSAAGFDAHVTKPVELNSLVGLIEQARRRVAARPSP